jgi:hypothetical protein
MRRRLLRYLLPALFAAFFAVPVAASPIIVGDFYLQRDPCDPLLHSVCDQSDIFEYFVLANVLDPSDLSDPLAGLTFTAVIKIGAADYSDQFFHGFPLSPGDSVLSSGLPSIPPFGGGGTASLFFTDGNYASYGGTLQLSNLLYDDLNPADGYAPSFQAQVLFIEDGPVPVTESPSWLVGVIGLSALAVGRALFS